MSESAMRYEPIEKLETDATLCPKIWADGEHDDVPGLVAAVENNLFEYDGELYKPDIPLCIYGREIVFGRGLFIVSHDYVFADGELPEGWVVARESKPPRSILIHSCFLNFRR